MGYYDPYPSHQLEKPLCLVGFMGSEIHMVGYFLSSMTGLPFIELDKWIEHEVGKTVAHLYYERGESEWRQVEKQCLNRALASQPKSIICLGDGTLIDKESRRICHQKSTLFYLRRPFHLCYKQILSGRKTHPQRYPYFIQAPPQNESEVETYLRKRVGGYEKAHVMMEMKDLSPLAMARKVMKRLDLVEELS